jgi:beta-mannosidase
MSEYGFQGIPNVKFLEKYIYEDDLSLDSPVLKAHQKHPRGMELIDLYMHRDYNVPDEFENYTYVSQLLQAEGITRAIEAHRRAKPYCMGTLYWQLNDCWPAISWSSIDYGENRKALHYFVKKSYDDPLISAVVNNARLEIHVVNDSPYPLNESLSISLISFDGEKIWNEKVPARTDSNSSRVIFSRPVAELMKGQDPSSVLLYSSLSDEELYAENIHYFVKPKNLDLKQPEITIDISKHSNYRLISISAKYLVKNLYLESANIPGKFSDNFFDVLPGKETKVYFTPDQPSEEILEIRYKSLFNTL